MQSSNADQLLAQRQRFRAFVISRLGNETDADDLLQNSLVKAIHTAGSLRDGEKLTSWFFQILRRSIIDHIRSRSAARVRDESWSEQMIQTVDSEAERTICACFEKLLEDLKPRDAELIRRVELGNESVAEAAQVLGLTANNASVSLYRARNALRKKLEAFCGSCAAGACLDCDCH